MVEKVTTIRAAAATTTTSSRNAVVRYNIFDNVSPLVGPNSSRCASLKNRSTTPHHSGIKKLGQGPIIVTLISYEPDAPKASEQLQLQIESGGQKWRVNRSIEQLYEFDGQLHRYVFNETHGRLQELSTELNGSDLVTARKHILSYLQQLSYITGSLMRCYSVLKFLEVDRHGNQLSATEETSINKPAIASAIVTKDFEAQTCDQLSLRVGDIVSIIDKTTPFNNEEGSWWKAKLTITRDGGGKVILGRNFEVGLFPSDCVRIFDGKSGGPADQELRSGTEVAAATTANGGAGCAERAQDSIPKRAPTHHRPRWERLFVRTLLRRHAERQTPPVFGTDLVEYLQKTGEDVPIILKKCVEVIEMHGIVTGVYRQCGIQSNIQKLRNGFDSGHLPDLCDEVVLKDIHSVSSLLKQYFRQLPNPLFTFELYPEFIGAYETVDDKRANRFKSVLRRLPREHYRTAKYLIRHLTKLCHCTHLTDMNSKNLAIVWAPNLFRCPPCVGDGNTGGNSSGDSSLLQGLSAQTGLCNYMLVHAVYLFSLEKDSLTLPKSTVNSLSASDESSCNGTTASPDLDSRRCIDVNGGPSTLPTFHTVLDRPRHRETSAQPGRKWRRMLRGPSVDNAFASLRTRWRKHDEAHFDSDNSTNSVKWRRSPSSDVRASLHAARSASLISFVTKSVEEFRNGVLRSWRHCAPTLHDESMTNVACDERHSTATAIATELVRRRGLTSFLDDDQQPSTSAGTRLKSNKRDSILEALSADTNDSGHSRPSSAARDDCVDDGVSLSSDSYRFFGFYEDEQPPDEECSVQDAEDARTKGSKADIKSKNSLHVAFSTSTAKGMSRTSKEDISEDSRSASTNVWSDDTRSSDSDGAGSLHNDRSRYDNVSPVEDADEGRYAETPLSFYDLPQNNIRTVRSNVQLYFL